MQIKMSFNIPPKKVEETIKNKINATKAQLITLAAETAEFGKNTAIQVLEGKRLRPKDPYPKEGKSGSLADNITSQSGEMPGGSWAGVGHIPTLNEKARHWLAIEWGSVHMVGRNIHGDWEGGVFHYDKNSPNWMVSRKGGAKGGIKKPIAGKHYLQESYERTKGFITDKLSALKGK